MKKIFFTLFLLSSISLFSQQRTGISYQALILNPNGEQLPGYNNQNAPLVNTDICIEFLILDENSSIEYSETQSVKTDKYGMVNLSIGNGNFAGGYSGGWSGIVWSEKSKKLKVNLDTTGSCSSFTEISNQDLTAVPFALFAPGQEGLDGDSAYEVWLSDGNAGSVQDYLDSLKGEKGDDGLSAFQIWKDLGNSETEEDFIKDLKGEDGADGESAYQIWLDAGNTGTEEEFLNSLKGESGGDGESASQSLINTTIEVAGQNCANGGIKIETGIDINKDGILGADEVNSSQTKYLCNGSDGTDGTDGTDGINASSGFINNSVGGTIPSNVILLNHDSSYTIPAGFIGEISNNFPRPYSGEYSSFTYGGSDGHRIVINGNIYSTGFYNHQSNSYAHNEIKGSLWLPTSSVISIPEGNETTAYTIKLHNSSLFTPKIINSESNVPSGKMWKLSTLLLKSKALMTYENAWNNTGLYYSIKAKINDIPLLFAEVGNQSSNNEADNINMLNDNDIWFPSGTKISPFENVLGFSILEYNTGGSTSTNPNTDTPPDGLKVGDEWGGGIVVYIDESGKRGRIMAKEENISSILQWSTSNIYTNSVSTGYTTGTHFDDNLGRDNSQVVLDYYVTNSGSAPAFEYARDIEIDGYDDWYVPTVWELNKGLNYLSTSVKVFLWTSTEVSDSQAKAIRPNGSGYSFLNQSKTFTEGKSRVLPFRSFGE